MRNVTKLAFVAFVAACGSSNKDNTDTVVDASTKKDAATEKDAPEGTDGSTTHDGPVTVDGSVTVDGTVTMDGGATADGTVTADGTMTFDGGMLVDAAPAACEVAATVTATGPVAGTNEAFADTNPPGDELLYFDFYNNDPVPDGFFVHFYNGFGAFAAGITTQTIDFATATAEQNPDDCGACVYLQGDVDPDNGPTSNYMPRSGTLTITSLQDTFTAKLTNVTFHRIDPDTGLDDSSTCLSTVASYTFTAPIELEGSSIVVQSHQLAKGKRTSVSSVLTAKLALKTARSKAQYATQLAAKKSHE